MNITTTRLYRPKQGRHFSTVWGGRLSINPQDPSFPRTSVNFHVRPNKSILEPTSYASTFSPIGRPSVSVSPRLSPMRAENHRVECRGADFTHVTPSPCMHTLPTHFRAQTQCTHQTSRLTPLLASENSSNFPGAKRAYARARVGTEIFPRRSNFYMHCRRHLPSPAHTVVPTYTCARPRRLACKSRSHLSPAMMTRNQRARV